MSVSSPTSVMTAIAVLGTFCVVRSWASRNSAQLLSPGSFTIFVNGASCTNRNGNSPCFQWVRQSLIMAANSVRYSYARLAFDSPWYQMAPRMAYGMSGAIMPLYRAEGLCEPVSGLPGGWGALGSGLLSSLAFLTASSCLARSALYLSWAFG